LMSLTQASQSLDFYSEVQLTDQAHYYEYFRAVLSFRLVQQLFQARTQLLRLAG